MKQEELEIVLQSHKLWIEGQGGKRANMKHADLSGANFDEATAFFSICCPGKGSFVGFKKNQ